MNGENRQTPARYNVSKTSHYQGGEVLTTLYRHKKLRGHPWGKLFRRDRLGLRVLLRYLKMRIAIRQVQQAWKSYSHRSATIANH